MTDQVTIVVRQASERQRALISTLARERMLSRTDLDSLCRSHFDVDFDDLTKAQASTVISDLKGYRE